MIMLVSSATASRTSSSTAIASIISMEEQMRHATAGEQVRLPVPTQLPAIPINETTPSLGSASTASIVTSALASSLPSMVEKTSPADLMRDSVMVL